MVTTDADALAAIAKRPASLLRDAPSVQRRLDNLAAPALAVDESSLRLIAEARGAFWGLAVELTDRAWRRLEAPSV